MRDLFYRHYMILILGVLLFLISSCTEREALIEPQTFPDTDVMVRQFSMKAFIGDQNVSLSQAQTIKKTALPPQELPDESWSVTVPVQGSGNITTGTPISINRTDMPAMDGSGSHKQNVPNTDGIQPITAIQFTPSTITARDASNNIVMNYQMNASQSSMAQSVTNGTNSVQVNLLQKRSAAPTSIDERIKYWKQKGYTVRDLGGKKYELSRSSLPTSIAQSNTGQSEYSATMIFDANTMKMEGGTLSRKGIPQSEIAVQHGKSDDEPRTLQTKTYMNDQDKGRKNLALYTTHKSMKNRKGGRK